MLPTLGIRRLLWGKRKHGWGRLDPQARTTSIFRALWDRSLFGSFRFLCRHVTCRGQVVWGIFNELGRGVHHTGSVPLPIAVWIGLVGNGRRVIWFEVPSIVLLEPTHALMLLDGFLLRLLALQSVVPPFRARLNERVFQLLKQALRLLARWLHVVCFYCLVGPISKVFLEWVLIVENEWSHRPVLNPWWCCARPATPIYSTHYHYLTYRLLHLICPVGRQSRRPAPPWSFSQSMQTACPPPAHSLRMSWVIYPLFAMA